MAVLEVQKITLSGLNPVYFPASAGGDEFYNTGKIFIHIRNGSASEKIVTINSQALCNYGFDHDVVVTVPGGESRMIGAFQKDRFDDEKGRVKISYSAVTGLTIAVIELP